MASLSYKDFKDELIKELREKTENLGAEFHSDQDFRNGKNIDSLSIKFPNQICCPILYFNDLYGQYKRGEAELSDMADRIIYDVSKTEQIPFELSDITKENARKSIILAVCNFESNKTWLDDKNIPYEKLSDSDVAVYPRWIINENLSFAVTTAVMEKLYLTKDEIFEVASKHTLEKGIEIMPIEAMISNLTGIDMDNERSGLVLAKLQGDSYGASVITEKSFLDDIHRSMDGDFYILLSSIHEVLLMAKNEKHLEEIKAIVKSINETTVSIGDRLSDNVLEYDGKELKIAGRTEDIIIKEEMLEKIISEGGMRHAI